MPLKAHTHRRYEEELSQLRDRLLRMAGRVEAMIADAMKALTERDPELAKRTIDADALVNRDEVELDDMCLRILAKRQPMASDLRFLTLTLKMVTDLERIADLTVNICERAIDLAKEPQLKPYIDLPRMATLCQQMIHDAIDAFVEEDARKARRVVHSDDEVDDLYDEVFVDILSLMLRDPDAVTRGIRIQSVAKYLERIADHCTNIAEQVVFMVKGKDIRHRGKLPD
jgi:phosphate transport system protein